MNNKPETLGDIIKIAREQSEYTVEELAEKIGITERYLYKIENEGKKPSYEVLYKLIRTLLISPDAIFYPEKQNYDHEIDCLLRMLLSCDRSTLNIVITITQALFNSFNHQDKKL